MAKTLPKNPEEYFRRTPKIEDVSHVASLAVNEERRGVVLNDLGGFYAFVGINVDLKQGK